MSHDTYKGSNTDNYYVWAMRHICIKCGRETPYNQNNPCDSCKEKK